MATSARQRNTTIDAAHHDWYKRIAASNPLMTMADLHRMAHDVFQNNYALMCRVQRPLQDAGIYMSNSELISLLLRMVIYKKIDLSGLVTTVNKNDYCSSAG